MMRVVGLDRAVLFRVATSERLERAVKTLPWGEAAAWRAAARYVARRSRDQALAAAAALPGRGHAGRLAATACLRGVVVGGLDASRPGHGRGGGGGPPRHHRAGPPHGPARPGRC